MWAERCSVNFILTAWWFFPALLLLQPGPAGQSSSGRCCRVGSQRFTQKLSSEDYDRAARSKTERCPFCLHVNLASYRHTFLSFYTDSTKCWLSHILAKGKCLNLVLIAAPMPQNNGYFRVNRFRVLALAGSRYLFPLLSPCCSASISLHLLPPAAFRCSWKYKKNQSRAHMNMFSLGEEGVAFFR